MIYTSYFSNIRNLPIKIIPISIARYRPQNMWIEEWTEYAPTSDILWKYKNDKITESQYRELYLDQLSRVDFTKITEANNIALVCYEKSGDFCHRNILAEKLRELNIDIEEYDASKRFY